MMAGWSTRFATAKLAKFFDDAENIATDRALVLYQEAADEAAEWWSGQIVAKRRAEGHGMERVRGAVTQPRRGGFFFRVGWLDGSPKAADGRTSWFVYQDAGYHLFGGPTEIPGLLLQIDARRMLQEGIRDANDKIAREIAAAARRV